MRNELQLAVQILVYNIYFDQTFQILEYTIAFSINNKSNYNHYWISNASTCL
jgi:hypothetical protein